MLCCAWTGAQWVSNQCRAKISELAKSGLILVDLRATITGELYGDAVWRFAQLPRPARQPPSAAAQLPLQPGTKGNQGRHENLGPARSHMKGKKEMFTLVSNHNGSLLRWQLEAMRIVFAVL